MQREVGMDKSVDAYPHKLDTLYESSMKSSHVRLSASCCSTGCLRMCSSSSGDMVHGRRIVLGGRRKENQKGRKAAAAGVHVLRKAQIYRHTLSNGSLSYFFFSSLRTEITTADGRWAPATPSRREHMWLCA